MDMREERFNILRMFMDAIYHTWPKWRLEFSSVDQFAKVTGYGASVTFVHVDDERPWVQAVQADMDGVVHHIGTWEAARWEDAKESDIKQFVHDELYRIIRP